jgi:ubiquinone/menaquinone biosynthesis C-methylase UbiE
MSAVAIHSYDLAAIDKRRELERLEKQAGVASELEEAYLRQLGLPADATILDVGCGPGFLSSRLSRMVSEGRVVGIDGDAALLQIARTRLADQGLNNVRFVEAWADDLPIQAGYADLSYARFLLQHVAEPRAVVREMVRCTKAGGHVVLADTDDGGLFVHPEPLGMRALLTASRKSQALLGGDRTIGRKLGEFLAETGLVDVRVEAIPFTSDRVGMASWVELVTGFKRQVIDPEFMSEDKIDIVLGNLRALAKRPGAYGHAVVLVARGRVPER